MYYLPPLTLQIQASKIGEFTNEIYKNDFGSPKTKHPHVTVSICRNFYLRKSICGRKEFFSLIKNNRGI